MCGIFCAFSEICSPDHTLWDNHSLCKELIKNRGPDYERTICFNYQGFPCIFSASVLWLQGDTLNKQPVESNHGTFIYNGDIFNYTKEILKPDSPQGDTQILVESISLEGVYNTFTSCHGPYAFVYLDKVSGKLYFGRDHYGRRSLLLGRSGPAFIICSVAKRKTGWNYTELPPLGIFCYHFDTKSFQLTPWEEEMENFNEKLAQLEASLKIKITIKDVNIKRKIKRFQLPEVDELEIYQQLESKDLNISIDNLLKSNKWCRNVLNLEELLTQAVKKRVLIQPKQCSKCLFKNEECKHCLTGVLFSGGVDCAILALLSDKFSSKERPIDLINVAFSKTDDFNTPDRLTGLSTLKELRILCPDRNWNFVEINVPEDELQLMRKSHIVDLIHPLNTILDDSLGCALWFASRGENKVYKSTCRVLLVGMGADELFGGYTKHRKAFKNEGWLGLYNSLETDWQNLPYRNLARDDRVVSDHGRQLRTPYLDENVVEFVRNLNCWERTYPASNLPEGIGEKVLLRSLAFKLGFRNTTFFKKRALQFGSRIANRKENGNDVSPRLI